MYGFMICLVIIIIIGILIVRRNNKIIENEEKKIKEIEESSQNISIKFKAEGDSIEDEYTNWDENEDDEEDGVSKYSYFARKHMMTNAEERCFRIVEEAILQNANMDMKKAGFVFVIRGMIIMEIMIIVMRH